MRLCSFLSYFLFVVLFSSSSLADGTLFLSIYLEGRPQGSVKAKVFRKGETKEMDSLETSVQGFSYLDLPKGAYSLELALGRKKEQVPFEITNEEETHLIVNQFSKDVNISRVEPEAMRAEEQASKANTAIIEGKLIHFSSGTPISGAKIFVKGQSGSALSNSEGRYKLFVPPGKNTLSISHSRFTTELIIDMGIQDKETKKLVTKMTPAGLELEDFVVLAPRVAGSIEALIEVRKNSSQVSDVMGQEQISKSGDSNAAGSLRRVTGLSLVDGKYVYVRGLGERYSNTLLNGVAIPSPDPSRKVVPLDLFPAGVLESLVVQKSFSADRPGEFGGGTISLKTNSIPDKFFLKVAVSQGLRDGEDGLTYEGGGTDWLGIDDGTRALPGGLSLDQMALNSQLQGFSNTHDPTAINENSNLPNISFSTGNRFRLGRRWRLGLLASGLYANGRRVNEESRATSRLIDGVATAVQPQLRTRSERNINLGGILGAGLKYGRRHEVTFNQVLVRNTVDRIYQTNDLRNDFDAKQDRTMLEWTESQLQSQILQGEHRLGAFKLKWSGALSEAERDQPDRREYGYEYDEATDERIFQPLLGLPNGYERRFSNMVENAEDASVSLSLPFTAWSQLQAEIEVGAQAMSKERDSKMQRYNLDNSTDALSTVVGAGIDPGGPAEPILGQCLGSCLSYTNGASRTDAYQAEQDIRSQFVKAKIPLTRKVSVSAGWRREASTQEVRSVAPFDPDAGVIFSRLTTENILPGATLNWDLSDSMKVRAAYSETVSRPDFRELSDTFWIDNERNVEVVGEPDLQSAVIQNYDLRWEWYFSRKENISLGLFYKNFQNPIEEIFTAAADSVITFQNVPQAENYGFEIEFRKNIGSFLQGNWSLSGNYSMIRSEVQLGTLAQSDVTSKERALQGQSPFMVNLLLDYVNEKRKIESTLVYNVFGERISTLGQAGNPDELEKPFHQLDGSISKAFGDNFKLRFKISNILDRPLTFQRADVVTRERRRGRGYSLSLSMRL